MTPDDPKELPRNCAEVEPRPTFVDRRPKPRRDWRTIPLPDHTGKMLTPEEWARKGGGQS